MILNQTVRQVLRDKGQNEIFTVSPDESVAEAMRLMARQNIGALLVLEDRRTVGIITERDFGRRIVLSGRSMNETTVKDIMTGRVIFVTPEDSVESVLALMTDRHIRHLPVFDGDVLIGMISLGDVVKALMADHRHLKDQVVRCVTHTDTPRIHRNGTRAPAVEHSHT